MNRHCSGAALAAGLAALATLPAQAAIVTFQFGAEVTQSTLAGVANGDRIVGFYTFDTSAPDSFTDLPGSSSAVGHYAQAGAAGFRVNGFSVLSNFRTGAPGIYVHDNRFGFDMYFVDLEAFSLSLFDATQTAFSSDDLPAAPPPVSAFASRQFYFGSGQIIGVLDTLQVGPPNVAQVPAPGTLALALIGLGLLRRARLPS